jgi:hypothetical protein
MKFPNDEFSEFTMNSANLQDGLELPPSLTSKNTAAVIVPVFIERTDNIFCPLGN